MWKPTNVQGLWFHGGNLAQCRHYSKFLALQLAARYGNFAGNEEENVVGIKGLSSLSVIDKSRVCGIPPPAFGKKVQNEKRQSSITSSI